MKDKLKEIEQRLLNLEYLHRYDLIELPRSEVIGYMESKGVVNYEEAHKELLDEKFKAMGYVKK